MEVAKLVLEYLKALSWPLVMVAGMLLFKGSIRAAFDRLKGGKGPMGIELEFQEQARIGLAEVRGQLEREASAALPAAAVPDLSAGVPAVVPPPEDDEAELSRLKDELATKDREIRRMHLLHRNLELKLRIVEGNLQRATSAPPMLPLSRMLEDQARLDLLADVPMRLELHRVIGLLGGATEVLELPSTALQSRFNERWGDLSPEGYVSQKLRSVGVLDGEGRLTEEGSELLFRLAWQITQMVRA